MLGIKAILVRSFCLAGLILSGVGTPSFAAAPLARAGPPADTTITPVDNYEQWKAALDTGKGVVAPTFTLTPGFELETLRSAGPDEGSWIALTFDPKGRLIVAREKRGLLRFTLSPPAIPPEVIDDTLEEVRGLLHTPDGLLANANISRGLFQLRDTTGNDRFDSITPLVKTRAGGHGRNSLALGPDGLAAMIHGDSVELPPGFRKLTPPTVPGLLPGDDLPHGHLMRADAGGQWTVVASGMRNPVGLDFNADGEAFTYDADAETDMGTPWYRPTHVRHLVSGADFGWRRVTGRWPPYYPDQPDNPPVTIAIGKGSPTGVKFGTRSHFPPAYQRALFILDWSYGRIVAVHLTPQGASYTARAETFLRGRPLNVTSLDFGPDGAMYFVTGGRNTQSALYRVRYVGPPVAEPKPTAEDAARVVAAKEARALRRHLGTFHGRQDPRAMAAAWPLLDNADPWIAHAARVAIEHQPAAEWSARALEESAASRALPALMALTRVGPNDALPAVLQRLVRLGNDALSVAEWRMLILSAGYATQRLGPLDRAVKEQLMVRIDSLLPHASNEINREACRLLFQLAAPAAVSRAVTLLVAARDQEEKLHYLQLLGRARNGWTEENRLRFFRVLAQTPSFRGGAGLPQFVKAIETEALASLPESERPRFVAMLAAGRSRAAPAVAAVTPRPLVREWTLADFAAAPNDRGRPPDLARGREIYSAALCALCHQLGEEGRSVGPDLTDVASRFNRHDLLESILEPSRVISETYRQVTVTTKTGGSITGRVAQTDFRLPVLRLASDPLAPEDAIEVPKEDIVSYVESAVSPMPAGLLNRFTRDEISDLLAYVEAGGDLQRRIPAR
ncbi:MAG: hypothetical protein RIQ93_651 [Verrucomicrobiota bacterium]|jgi:putative heme-binding domain-containing protein